MQLYERNLKDFEKISFTNKELKKSSRSLMPLRGCIRDH